MLDGRRRQTAILLLVPAAVVGASLAGCTSSSSSRGRRCAVGGQGGLVQRLEAPRAPCSPGSTAWARRRRRRAATTPRSRREWRPGSRPAAPRRRARRPSRTGSTRPSLAGATAASVTFKVGGNDVSELIAAAPGTAAASALAGRLPASCARYKATVDGKTVTYSVTESALTGIGKQAKVLNVASAAGGSDARWSLVYRGDRLRRRGDAWPDRTPPGPRFASWPSRPTRTRPSHCPRTARAARAVTCRWETDRHD